MITPNKNLQAIWSQLPLRGEVLDLGFGRGHDSLFLADEGFNVTAIDKDRNNCDQLARIISEKGIKNIQMICKNIEDFEIGKEKYSLINAINVIQFLEKSSGLEMIQKIKRGIINGGYVIINAFTKQDPMFSRRPQNCIFDKDELKNLFADFEIIIYEEKIVDDHGHHGYEQPHQHGIVLIIAKKSGV
jgi:tellurite methyltransferase